MATETMAAAVCLESAAGKGDLVLAGRAVEVLKKSVVRLIQELAEMRDLRPSRPPDAMPG
jgi:hypothetical protein